MNILSRERAELDRALPGFDSWLAELGTTAAEDPQSGVLAAFRAAGGGNLLIPAKSGGGNLDCLAGARVQRAIGSRAPSLAVASTMHHYKVAWLAEVLDDPQPEVLRRIVTERHLVASCGAEGSSGRQLFAPGIEVTAADGGLRVSGTKRPCSLVRSMGLLSLLTPGPAGSPYAGQLLIVLASAAAEGVGWEPLWGNRALRAAETDAVVLDDVFVPDDMIIPLGDPARSTPRISSIMIWFLPLITAAYLGVATGQVEQLFRRDRGSPADRVAALGPLETASAAVEALAREVDTEQHSDDLLGRLLMVRYTAQRAIAEATDRVLELMGGMSFVTGGDGVELLAASRALAFHPPAEGAMPERMDTWLKGGELRLT